jgi:hypothetical protein
MAYVRLVDFDIQQSQSTVLVSGTTNPSAHELARESAHGASA